MATHDLDLVLELYTRALVLQTGKVAVDEPAGDILRDKALLKRCGLDLPLVLQACPVCNRRGASAGTGVRA